MHELVFLYLRHVNDVTIYNTGLMRSTQAEAFVLSDEMFTANIHSTVLSQLFGTKVIQPFVLARFFFYQNNYRTLVIVVLWIY